MAVEKDKNNTMKKKKEKVVHIKLRNLETLREEAKKEKEYYEQLLRLSAEFDNFRKRQEKERQEFLRFGQEAFIVKFLPVLDEMEKILDEKNVTPKTLLKGLNLIQKNLFSVLTSEGLERQKVIGEPFNPLCHEVVETVDSKKHKNNEIVEELRPGYLLRGKVIRPAMVKIAKHSCK